MRVPYAVKLDSARRIVGRLHVGVSYCMAIRYLRSRFKTWPALSKAERRAWMKAAVQVHRENRELYRRVME